MRICFRGLCLGTAVSGTRADGACTTKGDEDGESDQAPAVPGKTPDSSSALALLPLPPRRHATAYQLLRCGMDLPPERFLTGCESGTTSGHQWKLCKPRTRTLLRSKMFSSRVVNDWNSLPALVVSAETVNGSQSRLDHHWKNVMFEIPNPWSYECLILLAP